MHKYMLNYVVKISSVMSTEYFEYYTIILRGGPFFRGHAIAAQQDYTFFALYYFKVSSQYVQLEAGKRVSCSRFCSNTVKVCSCKYARIRDM